MRLYSSHSNYIGVHIRPLILLEAKSNHPPLSCIGVGGWLAFRLLIFALRFTFGFSSSLRSSFLCVSTRLTPHPSPHVQVCIRLKLLLVVTLHWLIIILCMICWTPPPPCIGVQFRLCPSFHSSLVDWFVVGDVYILPIMPININQLTLTPQHYNLGSISPRGDVRCLH